MFSGFGAFLGSTTSLPPMAPPMAPPVAPVSTPSQPSIATSRVVHSYLSLCSAFTVAYARERAMNSAMGVVEEGESEADTESDTEMPGLSDDDEDSDSGSEATESKTVRPQSVCSCQHCFYSSPLVNDVLFLCRKRVLQTSLPSKRQGLAAWHATRISGLQSRLWSQMFLASCLCSRYDVLGV